MATTNTVTALLDEVIDGAADEVVVAVGAVVVTNAFPGIDAKVGVPSVSSAVFGLPGLAAAAAARSRRTARVAAS